MANIIIKKVMNSTPKLGYSGFFIVLAIKIVDNTHVINMKYGIMSWMKAVLSSWKIIDLN